MISVLFGRVLECIDRKLLILMSPVELFCVWFWNECRNRLNDEVLSHFRIWFNFERWLLLGEFVRTEKDISGTDVDRLIWSRLLFAFFEFLRTRDDWRRTNVCLVSRSDTVSVLSIFSWWTFGSTDGVDSISVVDWELFWVSWEK